MVAARPLDRRSASRRQFVVRAHHDDEVGGWWADSDDIPGLITEAPTYDALVARVTEVLPDICSANGIVIADGDVTEIRRVKGPASVVRMVPAKPLRSRAARSKPATRRG